MKTEAAKERKRLRAALLVGGALVARVWHDAPVLLAFRFPFIGFTFASNGGRIDLLWAERGMLGLAACLMVCGFVAVALLRASVGPADPCYRTLRWLMLAALGLWIVSS